MRCSPGALWVVLSLGVLSGCDETVRQPETRDTAGAITGIRYLAGSDGGSFRRADRIRAFTFPQDHGPHPDYRTEWWYFTGNLLASTGRHFGFELTFFRLALGGDQSGSPSEWRADAVWMAHFAITDTDASRFVAAERLARGHEGIAYAIGEPFAVRVEDWHVEGSGPDSVRLYAEMPGYAIELELAGFDRIVLNGDRGYDRKGPEPGNASYYYSAPRLEATGTIDDGEPIDVSGAVWFDREWSTSSLSPGIEGWDWFALQLSDGRDLMYYRLRAQDGATSAFSGGTLTERTGSTRRLAADDVALAAQATWRSPATGVVYPVQWRLQAPAAGLDLQISPVLPDQELDLSVRYWEGAVVIGGTSNGEPVDGRGYLELAGYR